MFFGDGREEEAVRDVRERATLSRSRKKRRENSKFSTADSVVLTSLKSPITANKVSSHGRAGQGCH